LNLIHHHKMELVTESDIYTPSIDDHGNYIDRIPPFAIIKKGLQCPCGSRKDKTYDTHTIFSIHTKTKHHQYWLKNLNTNKANYYVENEGLKNTIHNQRLIIANLEKEIQKKNTTIINLSQHFTATTTSNDISSSVATNLLDFD